MALPRHCPTHGKDVVPINFRQGRRAVVCPGGSVVTMDGKPVALIDHAVDCGGVVIGSASGEGS